MQWGLKISPKSTVFIKWSDVAEVVDLSEAEFTHHFDTADISTSGCRARVNI